ncbi:MAG TPA: T9SS type A sorting domain-containing protein [Bacteroidia bacterium]|jgi:hypothetical protein|nr:T9SS type A sorting domain-containing protein [Bacteroidia bacterium]
MRSFVKTSIIFFLLFAINTLSAQYIIAGHHGVNDYYTKIDTNFFSTEGSMFANKLIDINGDSIPDVNFYSYFEVSVSYGQIYCEIDSRNSSQIASGIGVPCLGGYMAYNFVAGDTISKSGTWNVSNKILSEYVYQVNSSCSKTFYHTDTAYVGIRVFSGNDTLYGWIGLTQVSSSGCYIIDCACNKVPTVVKDSTNNISNVLYPNPSNGIFTLQTQSVSGENEISVYNVLGERIYCYQFLNSTGAASSNMQFVIDLSDKSAGTYFYRLTAEDGHLEKAGKLIIK